MKFFLIYRNAQILKNKQKKALGKVSKVKKKSRENYQNLSKKRKKPNNMGVNDIKIFLKMKNKH